MEPIICHGERWGCKMIAKKTTGNLKKSLKMRFPTLKYYELKTNVFSFYRDYFNFTGFIEGVYYHFTIKRRKHEEQHYLSVSEQNEDASIVDLVKSIDPGIIVKYEYAVLKS